MEICNHRWYYHLVPKDGDNVYLTRKYPIPTLFRHLVVNFCLPGEFIGKPKELRLFGYFEDVFEFHRYVEENFKDDFRFFHEVIFGELPQKPRFDLDINPTEEVPSEKLTREFADEIFQNLIENIVRVLNELKIKYPLEKTMIFSSHSNDPRKVKFSFHIVLNGLCHSNNEEAEAFFRLVVKGMKKEFIPFIDTGIYKPIQNFRMPRSVKFDKQDLPLRTKINVREWLFSGNKITTDLGIDPKGKPEAYIFLFELLNGLISQVNGCDIFPRLVIEPRKKRISMVQIADETVQKAIELCQKNQISMDSFDILDVKGGLIILRSLESYDCPICHRFHEHENPYLLIKESNVYFNCRRSDQRLLVSSLNVVDKPVVLPSTIEEEVIHEEDLDVIDEIENMTHIFFEEKKLECKPEKDWTSYYEEEEDPFS